MTESRALQCVYHILSEVINHKLILSFVKYISRNNENNLALLTRYRRAKSFIVAELAFSSAPFLFTQTFTSGQPHYREAPFSFASATIFFLSLLWRAGLVFIHLQSADGLADLDVDSWWILRSPQYALHSPSVSLPFSWGAFSVRLSSPSSLSRPRPRTFFWFFLGATERNVPGKIRI